MAQQKSPWDHQTNQDVDHYADEMGFQDEPGRLNHAGGFFHNHTQLTAALRVASEESSSPKQRLERVPGRAPARQLSVESFPWHKIYTLMFLEVGDGMIGIMMYRTRPRPSASSPRMQTHSSHRKLP